ncbi:MAG: hypothetical protein IPN76_26605 [Saprospiraceae bacterium]|nr:hypothetical protein [Saprospiraceae bacterium]
MDTSLSSTKALFQELTSFKDDKEIEAYLVGEIPNTDYEAFVNNLKNTIAAHSATLVNSNEALKKLDAQKAELIQEIAGKTEKQNSFPEKQKEIEEAIAQIDTEINQIKALASDDFYINRIAELENKKTKHHEQLKAFPNEANKLAAEIAVLEDKLPPLPNCLGGGANQY